MTQDMRKDTILMTVQRSSGFISTTLRSLLLLVLMTVGVNSVWGQTDPDYSGTYYIRSESPNKNTDGDYYMCPTRGWYLYKATNSYEDYTDNDDDNGKPFLTTYQCKTNSYDDISKAVWTIVKHPTEANCYYIRQKKTGRYMVSNGAVSSNPDRARVHLETISDPDDLDEKALQKILVEPKNSIVRQYKQLFKIDGFEVEFEDDAIAYIANKAMKLKTGARGIRTIMENKMFDLIFELPSADKYEKIIITKDFLCDGKKPVYVERQKNDKLNLAVDVALDNLPKAFKGAEIKKEYILHSYSI